MSRGTKAGLTCVAILAFWVGFAFGIKGQPFNTNPGVFGWGHILLIGTLTIPQAIFAYIWGANEK